MREKKVYYACYGSNLQEERFRCYIRGGRPDGADRYYNGCSDKGLPDEKKPITLKGELYFAKRSTTWHGGGAAFLHPTPGKEEVTLGKMYRIKTRQFLELFRQENRLKEHSEMDLDQIIENGSLELKKGSWYGKILFLGKDEGYPIFSFTNESYLVDKVNPPHRLYLRKIIEGLKETFKLSPETIEAYLKEKKGIKGFPIEAQLQDLVRS